MRQQPVATSLDRTATQKVREKLLAWFAKNQRSFVWRQDTSPFTILVAEILLKKTSAAVVNRFLPPFLERYGSIDDLLAAPVEELQLALAPIGLSAQRSRQMKDLAQAISSSYHGIIPSTKNELLQLPGIGPYTASALRSFAFRRPEAIVDTNVARVIIRLYGKTPSCYEARRSPEIWAKAGDLVSSDGETGRQINWALLDLGALVCKARAPHHSSCPLHGDCASRTSRTPHSSPLPDNQG